MEDHNNVRVVKHDKSVVLEGFTGVKHIDSVSIRGITTFHDGAKGSQRGRNSVYTVRFEDITFCHLGDLGHELSQSQVGEIGQVGVLFIPVEGFYTIRPQQARKVVESLKPRITVPMHYKLPNMSATFDALSTVEDFIRTGDNVKRLDGPSFTVTKADLQEKEAEKLIAILYGPALVNRKRLPWQDLLLRVFGALSSLSAKQNSAIFKPFVDTLGVRDLTIDL